MNRHVEGRDVAYFRHYLGVDLEEESKSTISILL
jgi:hypothetical protein